MRVFITGGSGYIGRPTISALRRRDIEVSALVRGDGSAAVVAGLGATPVRGGLTDVDVLRAAAADADGVIHLGQARADNTADIDRAASEALLAGLGGRGAYVHTGGTWVYGDTDGVVDEDAPTSAPPLVAWRAENEKRVLASAANGAHPVIVMPGLVYGAGAGLLEIFYAAPGRAENLVRSVGDGSNHWSLVHVEDVAELYVAALHAPAGASYAGVIDLYPTQAEVVASVASSLGIAGRTGTLTLDEARAKMGPIAEAFVLDQRLTGARARQQLDWQPRHLDPVAELAEG
ncbi:MAG TPA: NAD-dependent epimerase/dehydratase family protein [Pseudonocardia sp.]|jgi:nucleoside-diphosphate-sugar epimerase|nr:NAD-dependent epimerase/dehydratase family protein [Pseudonocardia sp.]